MHRFSLVPSYIIPYFIPVLTLIRITEFKEIRKQWKARKKEEENRRRAAEERERNAAAQAAAQAAQASGRDPATPGGVAADLSQPPHSGSYPAAVRPQLPPLGYQPATTEGQYGSSSLYQGNGQIAYPPPSY